MYAMHTFSGGGEDSQNIISGDTALQKGAQTALGVEMFHKMISSRPAATKL